MGWNAELVGHQTILSAVGHNSQCSQVGTVNRFVCDGVFSFLVRSINSVQTSAAWTNRKTNRKRTQTKLINNSNKKEKDEPKRNGRMKRDKMDEISEMDDNRTKRNNDDNLQRILYMKHTNNITDIDLCRGAGPGAGLGAGPGAGAREGGGEDRSSLCEY